MNMDKKLKPIADKYSKYLTRILCARFLTTNHEPREKKERIFFGLFVISRS